MSNTQKAIVAWYYIWCLIRFVICVPAIIILRIIGLATLILYLFAAGFIPDAIWKWGSAVVDYGCAINEKGPRWPDSE